MNRLEAFSHFWGIPTDILEFIHNTFDLYEIRGRVEQDYGVLFEVRSKETNHNIPHIHASYGEFQISISIMDGNILAGNLPKKQQKSDFMGNLPSGGTAYEVGKSQHTKVNSYGEISINMRLISVISKGIFFVTQTQKDKFRQKVGICPFFFSLMNVNKGAVNSIAAPLFLFSAYPFGEKAVLKESAVLTFYELH